jgi:hypothetical protein
LISFGIIPLKLYPGFSVLFEEYNLATSYRKRLGILTEKFGSSPIQAHSLLELRKPLNCQHWMKFKGSTRLGNRGNLMAYNFVYLQLRAT